MIATVKRLCANYLSRREISYDSDLRRPTYTSAGGKRKSRERFSHTLRVKNANHAEICSPRRRVCVCVCVPRSSEGSEDEMSGRCKVHAAVCAYVSLCEHGSWFCFSLLFLLLSLSLSLTLTISLFADCAKNARAIVRSTRKRLASHSGGDVYVTCNWPAEKWHCHTAAADRITGNILHDYNFKLKRYLTP